MNDMDTEWHKRWLIAQQLQVVHDQARKTATGNPAQRRHQIWLKVFDEAVKLANSR